MYFTCRLVSIDLHTKVLSFYHRAPEMTPQNWATLEIVSFQPPARGDAGVSSSDGLSFAETPASVNVQARWLSSSLPVTAGDGDTYFIVSFEGSDVRKGDEVKISFAGDCNKVIDGGGPFAMLANGAHAQRFALSLNTSGTAQICYASSQGSPRCALFWSACIKRDASKLSCLTYRKGAYILTACILNPIWVPVFHATCSVYNHNDLFCDTKLSVTRFVAQNVQTLAPRGHRQN
jgi:hypothetical protein